MARPAVNLSHEVMLLLRALEGAMLLAEQFAELHLLPAQEVRFRLALPAMLVLLRERMLHVERVARGECDPASILIAENEAFDPEHDKYEVCLRSWSPRRRMRWLRRELARRERQARPEIDEGADAK
jgi:hypothetical protein